VHTHLFERYLAVLVFVHLLDHGLEGQVRLRRSEPLHHQLHLDEVQEAVAADVIPATQRPWPLLATRLVLVTRGRGLVADVGTTAAPPPRAPHLTQLRFHFTKFSANSTELEKIS